MVDGLPIQWTWADWFGGCRRLYRVQTTRWWCASIAMAIGSVGSGCVERVILDVDSSTGVSGTDRPPSGSGLGLTGGGPECTVPGDCDADQTCFEGVCVGMGMLRVSLAWWVISDLDLHLTAPNGDTISFMNPRTTYAELDVDDCVSGVCSNTQGPHVENIVLGLGAPRGTYQIQVVNYDGRAPTDYRVEVRGAVEVNFEGDIQQMQGATGPTHSFHW